MNSHDIQKNVEEDTIQSTAHQSKNCFIAEETEKPIDLF